MKEKIKKERKPRKKAEPKIKIGGKKCYTSKCDNFAEVSPPGRNCTDCRLILADFSRISYNKWKKSRGLPVETKEQEIERILAEKAEEKLLEISPI